MPKLKKCLFSAPDRPSENSNIFWRDLRRLFFFFLVTANRDWMFRYCSRIYVRNWFTLLNEQNPLLDLEGTRFVNEKKKIPLPTDPLVGSAAGNEHIFKGGLIVKTFTFDFNFVLRYGLRLLVLKYSFKPGDVIGKGDGISI